MTEEEAAAIRARFGEIQVELLRAASFLEVALDHALTEWIGGTGDYADTAGVARKVFFQSHVLPAFGFGGKVDLFAILVGDYLGHRDDQAGQALQALRTFNTNRNMVAHGHYWRSDGVPHIWWDRRGKTTKTPLSFQLLDGMVEQAQEVLRLAHFATQALQHATAARDANSTTLSKLYAAFLATRDAPSEGDQPS